MLNTAEKLTMWLGPLAIARRTPAIIVGPRKYAAANPIMPWVTYRLTGRVRLLADESNQAAIADQRDRHAIGLIRSCGFSITTLTITPASVAQRATALSVTSWSLPIPATVSSPVEP